MARAEYVCNSIRELMSRGSPHRSTIRAAHTEFVAALAGHPPHPIYGGLADAGDVYERADHVETICAAFAVYLTAILADTGSNISGGALDRKYIDGVFEDFAADAVGGIRNAADELAQDDARRAS